MDQLRSKPHVVILGAGASIAAIPNGDKNGRKTSVMKGFIKKLGMEDTIKDLNLTTTSDNLEDIYSELITIKKFEDITKDLEKRIYEYFSSLEIPDEPTVYDYLLLSLTEKDLIATFNWDPLLLQAYQRVHEITDNLPKIAFLHGNVAYGNCKNKHEKPIGGFIYNACPDCGEFFQPSKLLYPIVNKDYMRDRNLKANWILTQQYINNAFMITIFGYSAPKTDKAAMDLLQKAWGKNSDRSLEEINIIDITKVRILKNAWDKFLYFDHFNIVNNFFDSYLGSFPRRSCETVFDTLFKNQPRDNSRGFKKNWSFNKLKKFVAPLILEEEKYDRENLPNPYKEKWQDQ